MKRACLALVFLLGTASAQAVYVQTDSAQTYFAYVRLLGLPGTAAANGEFGYARLDVRTGDFAVVSQAFSWRQGNRGVNYMVMVPSRSPRSPAGTAWPYRFDRVNGNVVLSAPGLGRFQNFAYQQADKVQQNLQALEDRSRRIKGGIGAERNFADLRRSFAGAESALSLLASSRDRLDGLFEEFDAVNARMMETEKAVARESDDQRSRLKAGFTCAEKDRLLADARRSLKVHIDTALAVDVPLLRWVYSSVTLQHAIYSSASQGVSAGAEALGRAGAAFLQDVRQGFAAWTAAPGPQQVSALIARMVSSRRTFDEAVASRFRPVKQRGDHLPRLLGQYREAYASFLGRVEATACV